MTSELEERGRKRKTENHKSNAAVSLRLKNPTRDLPKLINWNSKKSTSYSIKNVSCYFIMESSCPSAF